MKLIVSCNLTVYKQLPSGEKEILLMAQEETASNEELLGEIQLYAIFQTARGALLHQLKSWRNCLVALREADGCQP